LFFMLWIELLLAVGFLLLAVAVVSHYRWIQRHVRHPGVVTGLVLVVSAVVVPTTTVAALHERGDAHPTWQHAMSGLAIVMLVSAVAALLGLRRPQVRSAQPRRVLVVAAHPDDLELACGGSLARFADQGHEVRAIVMSHGARGGHAAARAGEAEAGAESLELAGISVLEYTDTRMAAEIDQMVKTVEAAIDLFEPDVILTHSRHDQHQDHYAVHLATLRGGRRAPTILCFESPSVTTEFTPTYFVDISDYIDVKLTAVRTHEGQAGKPYMGRDQLTGMALFRGSQAKVGQAEGFEVVRALSSGIGDL
jgi:LmbE family N-acetylglucosaminyl deacetylase